MKRSKWCKYCAEKIDCIFVRDNEPCNAEPIAFLGFVIMDFRDWLAKLVRETRYIEDNGFIECARMLDPEKSAKVAARVHEIKEWREQK